MTFYLNENQLPNLLPVQPPSDQLQKIFASLAFSRFLGVKLLPFSMSDVTPAAASSFHLEAIARETGISLSSVTATAKLLSEGATIPFISRYRKEATGMLDEVQVQAIRDRMLQLAELDSRRGTILKSLDERKLLSDELKAKVLAAKTVTALEDIFAPFRPKRQTRATKAIDRGLAS